ncbi:hypothetical protein ACQP1W_02565 [Spirillospora sp. CA-255316]
MSDLPDIKTWADRYVALWNEPDAGKRRALISELWAPDGMQVLVDPPQAIRDAATELALPAPPLEARGHEALNARVTRAYEMFVAPGEHVFTAAEEAFPLLPGVLGVRWAMVSTGEGRVAGGGLDVLALDGEGRIRTDHQFLGVS